MTVMRLLLVLCVATLAVAGSATAASPDASVRVTMRTSSTKPLAGAPWRYTIAVTDRERSPVAAKVRLQILVGQLVVGCWKRKAIAPCFGASAGTWIRFKGRRTATIAWPARLAGARLTFQAIVVAKSHSLRLGVPVEVQLSQPLRQDVKS